MYYPKTKVVFPHIPKTGGSSLEYFIGQVEHPKLFSSRYKGEKNKMKFLNDLYKRYSLEPKGQRWNIHRPAKTYLYKLGEEEYNSCHSFSFVRNPFSQIKSLYTMNREDMKKRGKPYPSWEKYIFADSGPSIKTHEGFLDQAKFLSDAEGNIIVDQIYPFEYYRDAVTFLSTQIGFEPDFEVKLWSTKPEYEYTPDMVERVLTLYGRSYLLWKQVKTLWEKEGRPYERK